MDNKFKWIEFYTKFADALLPYKNDRTSLIKRIQKIYDGIHMTLAKMEINGTPKDIDPFTIYGLFNKGITDEKRKIIINAFIAEFSITSEAPDDFSGIPVLMNMSATFYAFEDTRKEHDIDNLWDVFEAAIELAKTNSPTDREKFCRAYNLALAQSRIKWNLTMALYWIRPYDYLSLDAGNREFIKNPEHISENVAAKISALKDTVPSGEKYLELRDSCLASLQEGDYMNRIIKSTVLELLKSNLSKERKKALRKRLVFFDEVEEFDLHTAQWNMCYDRNNQSYQMVVSICYLITKGLLQTQTNGKTKLMDFLDEQRMHRLYEKFILAYYRREFPQIKANPSQVSWQLDDDVQDMLPTMQTDIMLEYGDKTLIIDTKYYSRTTQQRYGVHTLHSGNLYQIFTYVKNKEAELAKVPHTVSGMLLYAKTDEEIAPNRDYSMSGNKISVRTLDLNQDFSAIRMQLDRIVIDHFE